MINIKQVSPQLILSCIVSYYFLIKVAGRGLTATFLDISTLREVLYLVATIIVGFSLITSLVKNMPTPKIMYGVSEPIEEEEEEETEEEIEEDEVEEVEEKGEETEEEETEEIGEETEEEEEEEEEEEDDSDSDYVPPKTRSRRKITPTEVLDSDNEFPCPL